MVNDPVLTKEVKKLAAASQLMIVGIGTHLTLGEDFCYLFGKERVLFGLGCSHRKQRKSLCNQLEWHYTGTIDMLVATGYVFEKRIADVKGPVLRSHDFYIGGNIFCP